jgi:hypothetical protein
VLLSFNLILQVSSLLGLGLVSDPVPFSDGFPSNIPTTSEVSVYYLKLGTRHSPGILICILSPVLKFTTAHPLHHSYESSSSSPHFHLDCRSFLMDYTLVSGIEYRISAAFEFQSHNLRRFIFGCQTSWIWELEIKGSY